MMISKRNITSFVFFVQSTKKQFGTVHPQYLGYKNICCVYNNYKNPTFLASILIHHRTLYQLRSQLRRRRMPSHRGLEGRIPGSKTCVFFWGRGRGGVSRKDMSSNGEISYVILVSISNMYVRIHIYIYIHIQICKQNKIHMDNFIYVWTRRDHHRGK